MFYNKYVKGIQMKKTILFIIYLSITNLIFAQNEIKLEEYFRGLKTIEVEIENETYNFLFDTGGGLTIVSPKVIEKVGRSAYGNFVGFRMSGEQVGWKLSDSLEIEIGGTIFFHNQVGIFDIMSLLPKEFEQIHGLISLKTFEKLIISLNLNENKLILETDRSFKKKIKNMDLIPSRFANGPSGLELNIFLGTKSNNRLWWFLFDSGNIGQAKISENIVKEWELLLEGKESADNLIQLFEVAGDSIEVPIVIDNIIYDGAFNFDLIQQSEFVISLKDEKIWKTSSR